MNLKRCNIHNKQNKFTYRSVGRTSTKIAGIEIEKREMEEEERRKSGGDEKFFIIITEYHGDL